MQVACVQLCSGCEVQTNIANSSALITKAVEDGAQFVSTPEVTNLMDENSAAIRASVGTMQKDLAVSAYAQLANDLNVHLLIGSLALASENNKLVNRSILFSPSGKILNWYDKIHMFDVDLGGSETYRESANYTAGERAVVADLKIGDEPVKLGMSICYDLRFAHLYRTLAKSGAQILAVPAAFTKISGLAHWHVLLRARAIETGCFVIAAAQSGLHENGRETFGHSLIISPWGEIIAQAEDGPGIIQAQIDLKEVQSTRNKIPALNHDRAYSA